MNPLVVLDVVGLTPRPATEAKSLLPRLASL
jgi:hypothetical protein